MPDPQTIRANESPRNHVFVVDGTLSSLAPGHETHAGRLYALLRRVGPSAGQSFAHHPGVQGAGLAKWWNAATGEGLNQAICDGYGAIASRYRPGDRIFLFGYSRGAYAVRSLAGLIGRVGLLRREKATHRRVHRAFRYYEAETIGPGAAEFRRRHCFDRVEIRMIGVWDTVKALGPPYPLLSYLGWRAVDFHDHALTEHVRAGYQALALDEDRLAFAPILWRRAAGWTGTLEQRWFPGAHPDIGGQRDGAARFAPLGDLSLIWMLERAEALGLTLPDGWRDDFPSDPTAPMLGARRGWGRCFLFRRRRRVRACDGQRLDPSAERRARSVPGYRPLARLPRPAGRAGPEPALSPPAPR